MNEGQSIPKLNSRYVPCAWCEARATSFGLSGRCKVGSNQIKVRSFKKPNLASKYSELNSLKHPDSLFKSSDYQVVSNHIQVEQVSTNQTLISRHDPRAWYKASVTFLDVY